MKTSQNHSLSILFWINTARKKSTGELPIFMRITVDGKRVEISMQRSVAADLWDSNAQKVKSKHIHSVAMNSHLDLSRGKVQSIYNQLVSAGEKITSSTIKNLYLGKMNKDETQHKTILQAFDYHNLKMAETVKVGMVVPKTLSRYQITRNKVANFIKLHFKSTDKPLFELRLSFITEFEHYLLTIEKIQTNTAHKYIKNVKKIMNMAVGLDWIPANPFNQFKCSYSNPEREVLNQEEINRIIERDFVIDRLNEVRDVFIFCCYTGFAYADVYRFSKEAMIRGLDGNLWISTTRQKTGTKESVPLLPIALDIIRKYEDHTYCQRHNKLLPVNSNQRYNAYLKEIADLCGIKKKLTSHIARHTFATTITLANGVPLETVSKMLGHNKLSTTQIYAKVLNDKVSKDMELLQEKLFSTNIGQKKIGS